MVLQRYALRFIISDATLDSLKLPRSTANIKQDPNLVDKEHKTESPICHSQSSEPVHKPKPGVKAEQIPTKPDTLAQQTSVSDSSSSPTPSSPLGSVAVLENLPPESLQPNELQCKTTKSPTAHQKQLIPEVAQPQTSHSLPQTAPVQPVETQPSLPSASPRAVPLLSAKPYCQPRSTPSGHKSFKVRLCVIHISVSDCYSTVPPPCSNQRRCLYISDSSMVSLQRLLEKSRDTSL